MGAGALQAAAIGLLGTVLGVILAWALGRHDHREAAVDRAEDARWARIEARLGSIESKLDTLGERVAEHSGLLSWFLVEPAARDLDRRNRDK